MVDLAFFLRDVAVFAEDVKKEANKIRELLETVCCMIYTQSAAADPFAKVEPRIEGFAAAGTPKCVMQPRLPARGTPEYVAIMRHLGATDRMLQEDRLRMHWPHLQQYVTELTERGQALPPGLSDAGLQPKYKLASLTKRKGVHVEYEEYADGQAATDSTDA